MIGDNRTNIKGAYTQFTDFDSSRSDMFYYSFLKIQITLVWLTFKTWLSRIEIKTLSFMLPDKKRFS